MIDEPDKIALGIMLLVTAPVWIGIIAEYINDIFKGY